MKQELLPNIFAFRLSCDIESRSWLPNPWEKLQRMFPIVRPQNNGDEDKANKCEQQKE